MSDETAPPARTLAVVTMAYNERDFLPLWLTYYTGQVGAANCYVVDHGSDDGSTADIGGASRVRLPRTPLDNEQRADFISQFCTSLLKSYDYVAYTDIDEFLVADPRHFSSLPAYCARAPHDVTTAFGMNLIHLLPHEPAFDPAGPVMQQRRWLIANASMCKPLLTRVPIRWDPGFHSSDAPLAFDDLLMFHLSYFDLPTTLRRQVKRRATPFVRENPQHAHKVDDAKVRSTIEYWSRLPPVEETDLGQDCPVRREIAERVIQSRVGREHLTFKLDLGIWCKQRWRLPARFQRAF